MSQPPPSAWINRTAGDGFPVCRDVGVEPRGVLVESCSAQTTGGERNNGHNGRHEGLTPVAHGLSRGLSRGLRNLPPTVALPLNLEPQSIHEEIDDGRGVRVR